MTRKKDTTISFYTSTEYNKLSSNHTMTITFIYFDIGGVLIKDFSGNNKWNEMLHDLGVKEQDKERFSEMFTEFEKEVCVGRDVEAFIPIMKKQFGLDIPDNYSFLMDFVNRFEANPSLHSVLEELKP